MKISIKEITSMCEKILTDGGIPKKEASIIVRDFIEGELLGKTSHGLGAFAGYYGFKDILSAKRKKITIKKNNPAFAYIDGGHNPGALVGEKARDLLVKKAKKYGIAMVGTYNHLSMLRPGSQAEYVARHGLVTLVFHNGGGALVPPYGGIDPIMSTNPIGYAIPTNGHPIVVDMATSERAWGQVRMAMKRGTDLPPDSYLDKKGNIAIKPEDAYSALTFGKYKGYAMALLVEILTGPLVGAGFGLSKPFYKFEKMILGKKIGDSYRGVLFIAIDPSKFVNLKKFKQENSLLIKQLKSSRKRKGVKEIVVPGEEAYRKKDLSLKRGWIELDDHIFQTIKEAL